MPNRSGLVATTVLNTKMNEVENETTPITTPEFNKLTAENFTARLRQSNLVIKTDFDK